MWLRKIGLVKSNLLDVTNPNLTRQNDSLNAFNQSLLTKPVSLTSRLVKLNLTNHFHLARKLVWDGFEVKCFVTNRRFQKCRFLLSNGCKFIFTVRNFVEFLLVFEGYELFKGSQNWVRVQKTRNRSKQTVYNHGHSMEF